MKPVTDYCKYARMKDGLQPACKMCMNDSYNRSRTKKKDHYQQVQNKRRRDIAKKLRDWKQERGCPCGETDVACLDLHHLDPSQKEGAVSELAYTWGWERLLTEMEKCIVLCSNCHRKHHAGRLEL